VGARALSFETVALNSDHSSFLPPIQDMEHQLHLDELPKPDPMVARYHIPTDASSGLQYSALASLTSADSSMYLSKFFFENVQVASGALPFGSI